MKPLYFISHSRLRTISPSGVIMKCNVINMVGLIVLTSFVCNSNSDDVFSLIGFIREILVYFNIRTVAVRELKAISMSERQFLFDNSSII